MRVISHRFFIHSNSLPVTVFKSIPVVSLVFSIKTAKAAIKPGTAKKKQIVLITELPRTVISGIPTT